MSLVSLQQSFGVTEKQVEMVKQSLTRSFSTNAIELVALKFSNQDGLPTKYAKVIHFESSLRNFVLTWIAMGRDLGDLWFV